MVKKRQSDVRENGTSTDSCEEEMNSGVPPATTTCQHIKKAVDTTRLRRQLKSTGLLYECVQCQKLCKTADSAERDDFEYDNTLWLCLKCGTQLCGRSRNQHALNHYMTPHSDSHALTMNTRSFEIWCYDCDNEVSANTRKHLLEVVELVKRLAQKPPTNAAESSQAAGATCPSTQLPTINNIELKIKSTLEQIGSMMPMTSGPYDDSADGTRKPSLGIPLPPPPPPSGRITTSSGTVPGMAKRVNFIAAQTQSPELDRLPRVRGLTNLGNTCFFNAVMQCLAQTPFLLDVLKELAEPGEEFVLPGGVFNFKDQGDIELPMIKGTLSSWGSLTSALANALEELQSGGGVFTPSKLFDKLCNKCPQFTGGDQHDAHELLRQLLESVRSEDLKRYQRVILQNLGYKDQDISSVSEEMRQKCKIYGNQASDRILRPEQVFRGFLVSTLTCQDCYNVSSRHEYFLDMSLPVAVEKPQPPQRRKNSPEVSPTTANKLSSSSSGSNDANTTFPQPSFFLHKNDQDQAGLSKSQVKKEKERERKAKRAPKQQRCKTTQIETLKLVANSDVSATSVETASGAVSAGGGDGQTITETVSTDEFPVFNARSVSWGEGPREDTLSSSQTTSEHSDADVEDNLVEDNAATGTKHSTASGAVNASKFYTDNNGNTQHVSEKRDDTPENMDKDSLEEDENDSGIATSPAPTNGVASVNNNGVSTSGKIVNEKHNTLIHDNEKKQQEQKASAEAGTSQRQQGGEDIAVVTGQLDKLQLRDRAQSAGRSKRTRTQSYSDWSTTIAPRYQCEDGECSVQSCLNNFTAVELMTGQNKVGCENCTRLVNGSDSDAKTVNTNATKQLLISSPPAVLILHLKRFQLGPRCIFRKLTRAVSYPTLLDIAAFCGSKVKNLPNINRNQKKLLYALYGVVEHSGGMYGGHYTSYVKVRPKVTPDDKRWKFLPHGSKAELDQDDDQLKKLQELLVKQKARETRMNAVDDSDDFTNSSSNSSVSDEPPARRTDGTATDASTEGTGATGTEDEASNVQAPPGKWYYVSDSRVQEVNEDVALKAHAYILFYERIY